MDSPDMEVDDESYDEEDLTASPSKDDNSDKTKTENTVSLKNDTIKILSNYKTNSYLVSMAIAANIKSTVQLACIVLKQF